VGALAATGTAVDSSKLGGKDAAYYIQPRNLLDNSDFSNPVNQRGSTSNTGSWAYCIDRWITENATATIENGGITVSNGYLVQRILKINMDVNKPYTLAICDTSGNIYIGNDAGSILGMEDSSFDFITIKLNAGKTIKWAALYEGSYTAETLPPYVSKGYSAELLECMRYFQKSDEIMITAVSDANGYYDAIYPFMMPMRTKPTITAYDAEGNAGKMKICVVGSYWTQVNYAQRLTSNTKVSARGSGIAANTPLSIAFTYEASADL